MSASSGYTMRMASAAGRAENEAQRWGGHAQAAPKEERVEHGPADADGEMSRQCAGACQQRRAVECDRAEFGDEVDHRDAGPRGGE